MIANMDSYRVNKKPLETFLKFRLIKEVDRERVLTEFAVASNCPLIVIYGFFAEILGSFDEELIKNTKNIIKFYGYTGIIGLKINEPEGLFK